MTRAEDHGSDSLADSEDTKVDSTPYQERKFPWDL
jgi:hypothetical protein